jgi:predicted nucleic acid-binding protein
MIVLNTNVVSEAMKPEPNTAVRAWLNNQAAETLYLSSVTLAELLFGIGALPSGKRKDMLAKALDGLMGLFNELETSRLVVNAFLPPKKNPGIAPGCFATY